MLRAIHELNPLSASQYSKSQYFNRRRPGDKPRGRYIIRGTPKPLPGRLYGERAATNSRRGEEQNLGTAKFSLGHWGLKRGHHLFATGEQTAARSNDFYLRLGPAAFRPIGAGQNDTEPWTRRAVSDRRKASTTTSDSPSPRRATCSCESAAGRRRLPCHRPYMRRSVCADRDRMAATIVRAIDQQPVRAR
jgi:hypothetical protein